MDGTSDLKLIGYDVLKTYFVSNMNFNPKNGKINIQPEFNREIKKIDSDKYSIELSVVIKDEENKESLPFHAEAKIVGTFDFSGWEEKGKIEIARTNSTAILFPYLRSLLSDITSKGKYPPYVLPVMNINRLFKLQK